MKTKIIDQELQDCYLASGEKPPDEAHWNRVLKAWTRQLERVPVEYLKECFTHAKEKNRKFKIIIPGQVFEAWEEIRKRQADRKDDSFIPRSGPGVLDAAAPRAAGGDYCNREQVTIALKMLKRITNTKPAETDNLVNNCTKWWKSNVLTSSPKN